MTRKALLLASASLSLLTACSGPRLKVGETEAGEVVEVTGEAMIDDKDPEGTKKRALLEAQKKAVEMVIGVQVSGKTLVEKSIQIEQNILARVDGYIEKYDVMKEWQEKPFQKTTIRALIARKKIADDLNAIVGRPEVGNPRVAVLLTEKVTGLDEDFEAVQAGRAFSQALLDQGYKVVDRGDLLAAKAEEVAKKLETGDASGVASLGKQLDAEVLIFGQASGQRLESEMLGGLFSYRVTLSAQAYKAQTNEIMLTVGKVASGLDASREAAASKGLGNAGKLAGAEMASRLAQELARRASVAVRLTQIKDLAMLKEFQTALTATPGVRDFFLRTYEGGNALIEVQVKGVGSQDLASAMERTQRVKAKVKSVTNDSLEVELQ